MEDLLFFLLFVAIIVALVVGLILFATIAVVLLFGYGLYLLFTAAEKDDTVSRRLGKAVGGILCLVISCWVWHGVLSPIYQSQPTAAAPVFQAHQERITPSEFLMTRGLSFSADGPVYIYKGYQDEKLLDYVPGMGAVHLNLVLRGGGNYYAVDPMPLTIISGSNDEVRFTIDYDP